MDLTDVHYGTATLVREYEPLPTSDPLHGVTFDHGRLVLASGDCLFRIAPDTGRIIDQLETFPDTGGLAHDGHYFWQHRAGGIQKLDARTGFVAQSLTLDLGETTGLECLERDLLLIHAEGRRLARIRVAYHALSTEAVVTSDMATEQSLRGLTWAGGELWSATGDGLVRIDPTSARILAHMKLAGIRVTDLAADAAGHFWCVDGHSRTLRQFACPGWTAGEDRSPRKHDQARPSSLVVDVTTREPRVEVTSHESPASVAGAPFARILVPIDFSPTSRRALATALLLQDHLRSEVHLLHLAQMGENDAFLAGVGGGGVPPGELAADARDRLLRFVEHLFPGRASGVVIHAQAETTVVQGIEKATAEIHPTLLILCASPRHGLLRTHVEHIIRDIHTTVTVLCLTAEPNVSPARSGG
ncbi:MAG TPA: universal stress protein [Polyangiaceae bacterium]